MRSIPGFSGSRVTGTTALVLLVLAPAAFATSECLQSSVTCSSTISSLDPVLNCSSGGLYAAYDIPAGTVSANAAGVGNANSIMRSNYVLSLDGSHGAFLIITAHLHVNAIFSNVITCPGTMNAFLQVDGGGTVGRGWSCYDGLTNVGTTLDHYVLIHEGVPFYIDCEVYATSGNEFLTSTVFAQLDFTVPVGATVTAVDCAPLAVHPTTWGYVKTLYH